MAKARRWTPAAVLSRIRFLTLLALLLPLLVGTRTALADGPQENACPTALADGPQENACPMLATREAVDAVGVWRPPVTPIGVGRIQFVDVASLNKDGTVDQKRPVSTAVTTYTYQHRTSATWWFRQFGDPRGELIEPKADLIRSMAETQLREVGSGTGEIEALRRFRSSAEIKWSQSLSVFLVANPKSRTSKAIISARSAELFDDMARVVASPHVVLASTPTFDTATIDVLDEATRPLFVEMETLDRGVVMIHSNDGKQYFVLRRSGAQTVAYATTDVRFVSSLVAALHDDGIVVVSGKADPRTVPNQRFTMMRTFTAAAPIAAAVEHATSSRAVHPRTVINGVPRTADECDAQDLLPSGRGYYHALAERVDEWSKGARVHAASSREHLLEALTKGSDDVLLVVAHSNGLHFYLELARQLGQVSTESCQRDPVG